MNKKNTQKKQKVKKGYYFGIGIFISIFLIYTFIFIWRAYNRTPYFMVILNSAHGGRYSLPTEKDGIYFDPLKKKYSLPYREGNQFGPDSEYQILYDLCVKINARLTKTKSFWNWWKFQELLAQYGKKEKYERIILEPDIVKKDEYRHYKGKKDVNRFYRLFDSPLTSIFKKWNQGILSFINKHKPEILINLDFNFSDSRENSLFCITVPHLQVFEKVKSNIINGQINSAEHVSYINRWFGNSSGERKANLLTDTWLYFTGCFPDKDFLSPSENSIGYLYNMINWNYKDKDFPDSFNEKNKFPQYNQDMKKMELKGKFWEREKYNSERFKRLKGDHEVGDNEYIGEETVKYLYSILSSKIKKGLPTITKNAVVYKYDPVSLYVHSLVINVNLGSLMNKDPRILYKEQSGKIADAICVALYSICHGYDLDSKGMDRKYLPKGKPIDFEKYYKYEYIGRKRRSFH